MKKILIASGFFLSVNIFAQFSVKVEIPAYLADSEIYLYSFNGSKEILQSKGKISNNVATFKVEKPYKGMMRAFFKKSSSSVNMVSENKNVSFKIELDNKNKISNVVFEDSVNKLFSSQIDLQKKQDLILPALIQIKDYYNTSDTFYKSLENEINALSKTDSALDDSHPFLSFYNKNQNFSQQEKATELKSEDFINFFSKSGEYLETSTILKPALINFLNVSKSNVEGNVDKLLEAVNLETPRGQTIMSELIEIFTTYNMDKMKDKYLTQAKNLILHCRGR